MRVLLTKIYATHDLHRAYFMYRKFPLDLLAHVAIAQQINNSTNIK